MPWPTPMHSEATPTLALRARIACTRVHAMRAPEQPIGCPSAIDPPRTLTRAGSSSSAREHASACAANASLSSNRSHVGHAQPGPLKELLHGRDRPLPPMRLGSTPAVAVAITRARRRRAGGLHGVARGEQGAAAPSLRGTSCPLVTVPPSRKAGLSFDSASSEASARTPSSRSNRTGPPFFWGTSHGDHLVGEAPDSQASVARSWERSANRSCVARG